MKEHAKKALKHDFKVAGKTIPTLAIVALFLVGTGSAALLTSFGTVSGTAEVDQPIQLNDQNQNTVENAYGIDTATGGQAVITNPQTVTNDLNSTVEVSFETDVRNGTDASWYDQSTINGVNSYHALFYEVDSNTDGVFDAAAEVVEDEDYEDGYAIHFSSDGDSVRDYITAYYPVSGLDSSDTLKFEATTGQDHDAGGSVDELYFVTNSGDLYSAHTNQDDSSTSVSVDLSQLSFYGESPQTWSDVTSIGIGYGDASAISSTGGTNTTIDVTVDDVRVGSTSIDSTGDSSMELLETGELYDGASTSRHRIQTATLFDVAVVPQNYGTETSLVPE